MKYSFRTLYDSILNVIDLESLPESKQTAKLSGLINLFNSERRRIQRINDWIKRKNQRE